METFYTTVTQKGQVTIPKSLRDKHNLKSRSRVKIKHTKNGILITQNKIPSFLDLGGTIKAKKGMDALKAREYMETHYERV